MTVLETCNLLYEWFSKNDHVFLCGNKDDFSKIILVSDNEEKDRSLLLCALSEFEKIDILAKKESEEGVFWFLKKPLNSYDQTVSIDPHTCLVISKIINEACEEQDSKSDLCDASKITNKDIKNLTYLILYYKTINSKNTKK